MRADDQHRQPAPSPRVLAILDAQHHRHEQLTDWDRRMADVLARRPTTRGWTPWHDEYNELVNRTRSAGTHASQCCSGLIVCRTHNHSAGEGGPGALETTSIGSPTVRPSYSSDVTTPNRYGSTGTMPAGSVWVRTYL